MSIRTTASPATPGPASLPGLGASAPVLPLSDRRAVEPAVAGAKAANLARAAVAGLPVLPGFVLTTGVGPDDAGETLRAAWDGLGGSDRPLIVRSSSMVEDLENSSMAGQFRSVVDVRGWDAFLDAVGTVRASAGDDADTMAVLVQPLLTASRGGVMFGVDPVTGDRRRVLVEAVPGAPHALVDGSVTATRYLLSRTGRLREADPEPEGRLLDATRRRRLATLARRAARTFGGPQDVEWAEDADGRLWLLQSRPVTATAQVQRTVGPLLGPGPLAETFPAQIRPLEQDLWVSPLRAGMVEALTVAGAAPQRRILDSPVVTVVDRWVAADLELLGYAPPFKRWRQRLDPRGPMRHLVASWRVGRLRVALADIARDLVDETDVALHEVPELARLTDAELVDVLDRTRAGLVALHAHEVLAGMLLDTDESTTAAGLGLRAAAAGRSRGSDDATVVAGDPVVLALIGPRIGPPRPLPDVGGRRHRAGVTGPSSLPPREALRLRARWVQELGARVAMELGRRWSAALDQPEDVALLTLAEVRAVAAGRELPEGIAARRPATDAPPLPATFRLTRSGGIAATAEGGDGHGAGGGRSIGPVRHADDLDGLLPGDVLVTTTLSPELAPYLERLGGLVSETGSVLSHLAILAREAGVPTVVGVHDARTRFPSGVTVLVDGAAGTVEQIGGPT